MTAAEHAAVRDRRSGSLLFVAAIATGIAAILSVSPLLGSKSGLILLVGVVALALGVCAVISPVFATILLLVAMFLRLPIRSIAELPIELFLIAFAAVAASTVLWMDRTPDRLRGIGAVEWAMAVYITWNFYSMFAPHRYPAYDPIAAEPFSVARFIVVGIVIPFALYVVGRYTFDRVSAVRALMWVILAVAAYSAVVSILPFTPLTRFVWPRYVLEVENPSWVGRAVGIFNHPVINGMALALGFAIAMLMAGRRSEPVWQRRAAIVIAVACGVGIYETHTRAAWLGGLAVLVIGALLARGNRKGYITILVLLIAMVALNWSTFTSSDREAGGVGSENEVQSRLNDIQTAFWAISRKPVEGWGIGRFQSVNTYHHQQWSPEIPFSEGFGEVSHQNELAITAELGAIGLSMWICVLALAAYRLWDAYRTLPDNDLCGKPLTVVAMMAMSILICAGLTVDYRFFEFSVSVIFLLVGIAVGWSDRHKLAPATDPAVLREGVGQHA